MPRAHASVPPEAIKIEDEVWQEAFARREPARDRRRLRAIDGGRQPIDHAAHSAPDAAASTRNAAAWASAVPSADPAVETSDGPVRPTWAEDLAEPVTKPSAEPRSPRTSAALAEPRSPRTSAPLAEPRSPVPSAALAEPGAPQTFAATADSGRRTVRIQGRGAERHLPLPDVSRRRPQRRAYERSGFSPDRLARWAVMLGFLLVLVAIVSGHG